MRYFMREYGAISAFMLFFCGGLIALLVVSILASDTSSWIVDGNCITLYRGENHVFSPDHEYVDTYCK